MFDWERIRDAEQARARLSTSYAAEGMALRKRDPAFGPWANKLFDRFEAEPLLRDYAGAQAYLVRMDNVVRASPDDVKQHRQAVALGELVRNRLQDERLVEVTKMRGLVEKLLTRPDRDGGFIARVTDALSQPAYQCAEYIRHEYRRLENVTKRTVAETRERELLAVLSFAPSSARLLCWWHDQLSKGGSDSSVMQIWDARLMGQAVAHVAALRDEAALNHELCVLRAQLALLPSNAKRDRLTQAAAGRAAFLVHVDRARSILNVEEQE